MADSTRPPDDPDPKTGSDRDFGDSAGYGSGGSALDRREVGDAGADPKGPNPLDEVVDMPPSAPGDEG